MPGPLPGLTESAPWSRAQCLISTTSIDDLHGSAACDFPIHPTTPDDGECEGWFQWSTWGNLELPEKEVPVRDCLHEVAYEPICGGLSGLLWLEWKDLFTMGGTIPWAWTAHCIRMEKASQVSTSVCALIQGSLLTVCVWYNQVLQVPASLISLQRWTINLESWAK